MTVLQLSQMIIEERIRHGYVVVVLLSDNSCEVYPGRDCVQAVIVAEDGLPFPNKDTADIEAKRWPDWCCPHTMLLTRAMP